MLVRYLSEIGKYFIMLKEIFNKPTKWSVMKQLILKEIDDLIVGSLGIVAFISFFVGGTLIIGDYCIKRYEHRYNLMKYRETLNKREMKEICDVYK